MLHIVCVLLLWVYMAAFQHACMLLQQLSSVVLNPFKTILLLNVFCIILLDYLIIMLLTVIFS